MKACGANQKRRCRALRTPVVYQPRRDADTYGASRFDDKKQIVILESKSTAACTCNTNINITMTICPFLMDSTAPRGSTMDMSDSSRLKPTVFQSVGWWQGYGNASAHNRDPASGARLGKPPSETFK
ncbi:jg6023 [Pararge aegeria aegeria]|uniref:Jg6023 protein n=1 Tax=Pararge aegeria aegeria TaxID=348720 RepID=A0A8S4QC91_9NEOP|nr:jg6023 [Pararge aegeria aegeria]